ncbi:hypothetical protein LTR50_000166 [Elasticomyces elasticus]|nr:hypothetical protein LTR50_000166 [Elasticomyces elasticus]
MKTVYLVLSALISLASAQTNALQALQATSSTGTTTAAQSQRTSSRSSASSSSQDPIQSIWGQANSLISSVYPSTTITNVAALTWPATVVIGSSTYSVHSEPTGTPSSTFSNNQPTHVTPSPSAATHTGGLRRDRTLGIVLGVVIGSIAFALVVGILFLLHRRKKRAGKLQGHSTPVDDGEIENWRQPMEQTPSSAQWPNKYNRLSAPPPPPEPMQHPTFARQSTYDSTSPNNPFISPVERQNAAAAELDTHSRRNSMRSASGRPITPPSQSAMAAGEREDPFASEEDLDGFDPPFIPTKSVRRMSSPQVHYPTWNETSDFDFGFSGGRRPPVEENWDNWASYLLHSDTFVPAPLRPLYSLGTTFKSYLLPLLDRVTQNPDLATIVLVLIILFLSLKILNMLWQAVMFWVRLATRIVFWGGIILTGLWVWNRGLGGVADDLGYWSGVWGEEYQYWKEQANAAGLLRENLGAGGQMLRENLGTAGARGRRW